MQESFRATEIGFRTAVVGLGYRIFASGRRLMVKRIVVKNATPHNVLKTFNDEGEKQFTQANPEEKAKMQAELRAALGISR